MVRAMGIDPGTGSFDIVVVEKNNVVWERSVPTSVLIKNPGIILDYIREAGFVDIIIGPSGYGTPIVCNNDIIDPVVFASEVLLLTSIDDIERGVLNNELGMYVYKSLLDVVKQLWLSNYNVCYIPSVIQLPTIPLFRKINKIDMGTVDKLASTILAIYDQSVEYGIDYSETNFILVETGFGYNAVIGVSRGRIVDGYGGTLVSNGMLTIGSIDGEVVVLGREWSRVDLFNGGVLTICNTTSIEEALLIRSKNSLCNEGFKAMYDELIKNIMRVSVSIGKPREVLLSGRLIRYSELRDELIDLIGKYFSVRIVNSLKGAYRSKESGQGYAIIGEGLLKGYFGDLIDIVELKNARGTVLDYVYHPRLRKARDRLVNAIKSSLKKSVYERILS